MRLTPRGERLLRAAYSTLVTIAAIGTLLLLMGVAGWIETLN
jgi:hypothetical protein